MKNPFPGMHPYFEEHWPDVHTVLIASIREQLSHCLPEDLVPRAEERITISDVSYRADVAVMELRDEPAPAAAYPSELGGAPGVAEPIVIRLDPELERWVEIREGEGRLVTVIEVLSPWNKQEEGQAAYQEKRRDDIAAGVNVVEIDLLRGGHHCLAVPKTRLPKIDGTCYWVCVSRSLRRDQREIYPMPLKESLPTIRIPLRPADSDVPLRLQVLVDHCFESGRYWRLDYGRDPTPRFSDEETRWLDDRLSRAGLR